MTFDAVRARLARPVALGQIGGFRPPEDLLASWLGRVGVVGPGEEWPENAAGPMVGLAQINLAELPLVPAALADLAFLALFVAVDGDGAMEPPSGGSGEGSWLLRAYKETLGLRPVEGSLAPDVQPFPVLWSAGPDELPNWDDATLLLSDEEMEEFEDDYEELAGSTDDGFKVGGWPSLIQGEIGWSGPEDPGYLIQIGSDEKARIQWGDGGVVHIGRGRRDPSSWEAAWQCF